MCIYLFFPSFPTPPAHLQGLWGKGDDPVPLTCSDGSWQDFWDCLHVPEGTSGLCCVSGGVRSHKSWGEQPWDLLCSNEMLLPGSVSVCIVHFPAFSYLYGNGERMCLGGAAGCSYRLSFGVRGTGGAGWAEKHQDPFLQAQLRVLQLKEGRMRPQSQQGWERDTSGWFPVTSLLQEPSWGLMPAGEPAGCGAGAAGGSRDAAHCSWSCWPGMPRLWLCCDRWAEQGLAVGVV